MLPNTSPANLFSFPATAANTSIISRIVTAVVTRPRETPSATTPIAATNACDRLVGSFSNNTGGDTMLSRALNTNVSISRQSPANLPLATNSQHASNRSFSKLRAHTRNSSSTNIFSAGNPARISAAKKPADSGERRFSSDNDRNQSANRFRRGVSVSREG